MDCIKTRKNYEAIVNLKDCTHVVPTKFALQAKTFTGALDKVKDQLRGRIYNILSLSVVSELMGDSE